jgi:catechol 2,3-dioxygenase-like lactoylglutathione lyase family enzyme
MLASIGESHAAKHQRIRVDHVAIYDLDPCGLRILADGLGLEGSDPLFQTSRGDAMNTDKKLAHFVLQTGQLPVLRDWYLKVLDAHVVYENQFLSLITFDEEHHRLGIAQLPQPAARTPMTVGLAHSAYTFPSLESLLTKYEDLKEADIRPHVPVQHGPTTSIYYRDPDGNMVELQIDNFTTSEAATEYLRGEEFHADPFGPSFDPAAMLAALRAGTPESELLTRVWARTCPQRNVLELLLA